MSDFERDLAEHRPAILRHCYRMTGAFAEAEDRTQETMERAWRARASFGGRSTLLRWLYAIATNVCLNGIARKKRSLPHLVQGPAAPDERLERTEHERWITPAPDDRLFPDEALESKETVALAFVALLQRVPPRQRAALIMKDVLGWSADEIAQSLELTTSAVNSALFRARQTVTREDGPHHEPAPETVRAFVQAWMERDLDALVALLKDDVTLAMPPYAAWFEGVASVERFLASRSFTAFWEQVTTVASTRANGRPAFGYFREDDRAGAYALMVTRFDADRVAEMVVFVEGDRFPAFEFFSP
ncbi:MAG: RNA polymerase subunit sigma-70 [Deltaproteobacteria bacterium]